MFNTRSLVLTALLALSLPACAQADAPAAPAAPVSPAASASPAAEAPAVEIRTQRVEYTHNGQVLEGYLAYNPALSSLRPGVLVIHEWTGINPYIESRTRQLAEMGYVAFAPDIYGKGVRPQPPAAAQEAGKYYGDRELAKGRLMAGLNVLREQINVDPERLAAIGYCFGGTMALELARSGADLKGFVSFHGGLNPTEDEGRNIQGKVLVLHGADDPFVSQENIEGFKAEMNTGKVDWQMVYYSGAVHAFTNPDSGSDNSTGAAYNADADRRSWEVMKSFFAEIF